MNINIVYLSEIDSKDKEWFKSEINKVMELVNDETLTSRFSDIIVLKNLDDFYQIIKNSDAIFNEGNGIRNQDVSHLTIYFTKANKINSYLIINERLISNSLGKGELDKAAFRFYIYKELVKICDDYSKIDHNLLPLLLNSDMDFNSSIKLNSNLIWKEYISSKKGVRFMAYKNFMDVDKFIKLLKDVKEKCDKLVEKNIEDVSVCYSEMVEYVLLILMEAARIIGCINGMQQMLNPEFFKAETDYINNKLKKSFFKRIYLSLSEELPICETKNKYIVSEENLEGIGKIFVNTLLELGMEYVIV